MNAHTRAVLAAAGISGQDAENALQTMQHRLTGVQKFKTSHALLLAFGSDAARAALVILTDAVTPSSQSD